MSPDAYYKTSHFFYLVRNFNSDIGHFSKASSIEKKNLILILERNVRLVILANYISSYFEKLDGENDLWKISEVHERRFRRILAKVYNFLCGIVNRAGIVLYIVSNFKTKYVGEKVEIDLKSNDIFPFNVSEYEELRKIYKKYVGDQDQEFIDILEIKFGRVKEVIETYRNVMPVISNQS